MPDIADFAFQHWKLAMKQAHADGEGVVSILATSVAVASVEAGIPIDEVIARIRDDAFTCEKAKAEMADLGSNREA